VQSIIQTTDALFQLCEKTTQLIHFQFPKLNQHVFQSDTTIVTYAQRHYCAGGALVILESRDQSHVRIAPVGYLFDLQRCKTCFLDIGGDFEEVGGA